ncbi:hypothetical protein PP175_19550 [Aneurinibacillus sp. Ricciae_BoGa-3]|uniref:hypothetical protein n=1 Tax=Aneurinibacillus sp. Ricciae_BoGa-3 TaxID=3022697 RepID=UPI00233F7CA5|nr:hypothetical protein [Aneurinibacillus sp. Ricciae_BoGa-3]WCK53513.1 hypothetical protein PP175_19550 [Aneurinibacillus sp. Ricciae_BoGa-3]
MSDILNGTSGPETPKENIVRHMSAPFFPLMERVEQRAKKTGKLSPSLRYPDVFAGSTVVPQSCRQSFYEGEGESGVARDVFHALQI